MNADADIIEFPVAYQRGYERYVGRAEAAQYLRKSESWLKKKSADLTFPSHKIGRNRVYRISELEMWIREQNGQEAA